MNILRNMCFDIFNWLDIIFINFLYTGFIVELSISFINFELQCQGFGCFHVHWCMHNSMLPGCYGVLNDEIRFKKIAKNRLIWLFCLRPTGCTRSLRSSLDTPVKLPVQNHEIFWCWDRLFWFTAELREQINIRVYQSLKHFILIYEINAFFSWQKKKLIFLCQHGQQKKKTRHCEVYVNR